MGKTAAPVTLQPNGFLAVLQLCVYFTWPNTGAAINSIAACSTQPIKYAKILNVVVVNKQRSKSFICSESKCQYDIFIEYRVISIRIHKIFLE